MPIDHDKLKIRNLIFSLILVLLFVALWTLPFSYSTLRTIRLIFGITGTFLMLSTELFYSLRKEGAIKTGSLRTWLRTHIATGLIGPALVIWHADFRFPGLGGAISYLTIIVVISGLFGRYIYRLIPRTIKGQARDVTDIKFEEDQIEKELRVLLAEQPEQLRIFSEMKSINDRGAGVFKTLWRSTADYYRQRRHLHRLLAVMGKKELATYSDLENLIDRRLMLERRVRALRSSKKLLARWIVFHKPLTLTLFSLIGVHVISIFYYGRAI